MLQDNFKIETVNTTTKQNSVFNNFLHKKLKKIKTEFWSKYRNIKEVNNKNQFVLLNIRGNWKIF